MLYRARGGAVKLSICCIAACACPHSEDEMFNAINTAISKDTPTYRVTMFSYPVQV